jgi:hypothetical protein
MAGISAAIDELNADLDTSIGIQLVRTDRENQPPDASAGTILSGLARPDN